MAFFMKNWSSYIRQISLALLFFGQPLQLGAQETPAGFSETTSLAFAIFKVLGSLALVVSLMLALVYLLKKTGMSRSLQKNSLIHVLDNKMVAPKKYIAIVEIAGKTVSLGITEHNINLLTEVDSSALKALSSTSHASSSQSFPQQFSGLLAKAKGKHELKVEKDAK